MGWDMAGSAWGQRHELYDLSGAVTLANAFIEASGRHVDWMHIPALDRSDDAFFTPLEGLKSQGGTHLSRLDPPYGAIPRAGSDGTQILPGFRRRCLLRVWP
jgi:hypothetical protein